MDLSNSILKQQSQNSHVEDITHSSSIMKETSDVQRINDCNINHINVDNNLSVSEDKTKRNITETVFLTLFSKRFRYCSKYDNDKLIEQSVYFNDKMVYKYREYSDYTMKEYDKKGNLVYEGEYKRIVDDTYAAIYRHGKGKSYLNNHLYFEGNWVKDIAKGDGIVYDEDGNVLHKG